MSDNIPLNVLERFIENADILNDKMHVLRLVRNIVKCRKYEFAMLSRSTFSSLPCLFCYLMNSIDSDEFCLLWDTFSYSMLNWHFVKKWLLHWNMLVFFNIDKVNYTVKFRLHIWLISLSRHSKVYTLRMQVTIITRDSFIFSYKTH